MDGVPVERFVVPNNKPFQDDAVRSTNDDAAITKS